MRAFSIFSHQHRLAAFASVSALSFLAAVSIGCSASDSSSKFGGSNNNGGNGGGGDKDASADGDNQMFGCNSCIGTQFQPCDDQGKTLEPIECAPRVCAQNVGCADCIPGVDTCVGSEVHKCNADGTPGEFVKKCDANQGLTCADGKCKTECEKMEDTPSNVGCEFWAVDLPNERGDSLMYGTAWNAPWGVVLSNAGTTNANVVIQVNNAPPGEPKQLQDVANVSIPPGELRAVPLPTRELTGWYKGIPEPPGAPMTLLTPFAFHIVSSTPLVVYQFNVFENSFSNDASLLLPSNGLGSIYRVLGMPTANPYEMPQMPHVRGMPDHTFVTVVGTQDGTHVSVKVAHDTMGDGTIGKIPPAKAGETITATLNQFDVLNLASFCDKMMCSGDMTGTIVQADKPVAVFSSSERTIAPWSSDVPQPPNYDKDNGNCCTDHLEEQMFPVTSLGKEFVISRSPIRSKGGFVNADIIRFMGVAAPSTVTTNLPPPMDNFTVQPGQMVETWTDKDFIATATEPLMIGQYLVSQGYCEKVTGDPSFTIFPPTEQYRKEYIILVPNSWDTNYFVIATPGGNKFTVDGQALDESQCVKGTAGTLSGTDYGTLRCPIKEGAHTIKGDNAFGLTVYGYGSAGSYAFAGGADVKPIYEPPPLK